METSIQQLFMQIVYRGCYMKLTAEDYETLMAKIDFFYSADFDLVELSYENGEWSAEMLKGDESPADL